MIIKLNFKIAIMFLVFLSSCSNNKLESLGLIKKKTGEYAISKKAPLEMPPDMYLRPPRSSKEKRNNSNVSNITSEIVSLDDILEGNTKITEKKINKNSVKKVNIKNSNIINKILKTKASIILK